MRSGPLTGEPHPALRCSCGPPRADIHLLTECTKMGFRDWSVKTKLVLLLCVLIGALVGSEAYNWHALNKSAERLAIALKEGNEIEDAVDTSRRAQVEFKTHVQEWKNLLVRGGDPKDYEQYS